MEEPLLLNLTFSLPFFCHFVFLWYLRHSLLSCTWLSLLSSDLVFSFYYCLNSVAWMWLLLYRKRHFLTECFQTLNLCHEELQSLLSWRFEVQDSRLHPMLEKMSPTDDECPQRSAVMDCNWPQTLGQVTMAGRWTSRATETSAFFISVFIYFLGFCFRMLMLALC